MKNDSKIRSILRSLNRYLIFFLLAAFAITCSLSLFINTMQKAMGIVFMEEQIRSAAIATFLNVLLISAVFTLIDGIRRRFTVLRPMKRIIDAAEKISEGDFSVRVPSNQRLPGEDVFAQIGTCFNKMAEELSGVETLRTDFIANVSHELKTPLAAIQNYGTLLQQPGLSEEKRVEYSKAITVTSRRLATLITNILKLNKLENQQILPQTEEYMLDEQIIECLLQYENIWEIKEIDIDTNIEESIRIHADAELLSLVWNNLFSNAFKFTPKGGKVSVSVTAGDKWATVKVSDNGCGMSPETGARIFEKFYQGDTSHSTQGNGLGLALVKRVVDMVAGEISVDSAIGEGTVFTVKIRRKNGDGLEKRM